MSTAETAASDPRDDIVDDRALEDAAEDEFGHEEFAAQAAQVFQVVAAPANIAIYAPWGSGKTSLANLLRNDLQGTNCGFVYFDAFKYAEAPLRREFIRRVSKELKITRKEFDRGLYEEEVTSGFKLDRESLAPLFWVGCWFGLAAIGVALLVALGAAHLSGTAVSPQVVPNFLRLLPAFFAPTIVIAPLIALVKDQLTITRHKYAPQSDEEFERLFRELVDIALEKKGDSHRLVVFIDELDRCAADEVASTLETLRTFLEVPRCVFVVAADRQVLERAAARKARQESPFDPRNPYYSAGSSYLDKIFQLQWHLPPLMGSSLSRFAYALVKDRKSGVWAEVDAGLVVSVLIPVHVQSPRRVKELLNAFAMTYRIAERRVRGGHLDCDDLPGRADELAKLICLQLEFPAFAADLRNEPTLPELVLRRGEGKAEECPPGVTPEIWDRAKAYAEGRIELDTVMARSDESDTRGAATPAVDDGEDEPEAEEPTIGSGQQREIVAAQSHLLIRYLHKTRRIGGPAADLIFLEGLGFGFGLSTSLAVGLKAAAAEGRIADASREIGRLGTNEQLAALQLLSVYVREALPGIEGQNVLRVLLGVVGELRELDLSTVVDEVVDAINTALGDDQLPPEEVVGAFRLALTTTRSMGAELMTRTLANEAVTSDQAIALFVLESANAVAEVHAARLGEVLAAVLVNVDWDSTQFDIAVWSDESARTLLSAARDPVLRRIAARESVLQGDSGGEPAPADAETQAAETESEDVKGTVLDRLSALVDAAIATARPALVEGVLELTLSLDTKEARDVVADHLEAAGLVRSESLTRALLNQGQRRRAGEQVRWLSAIDPSILVRLEGGKKALDDALTSAWAQLLKEADDYEEYSRAASRLARAFGTPFESSDLAGAIGQSGIMPDQSQVALENFTVRAKVASKFESEGLVSASDWRPPFLEALGALVTHPLGDPSTQPLALNTVLDNASALVVGVEGDEAVANFGTAIAGSPWLTDGEKQLVRLEIAAGQTRGGVPVPSPVTGEELLQTRQAAADEPMRATVDQAIKLWLSTMGPSVTDVWELLRPLIPGELPQPVREGLSAFAASLKSLERTDLFALTLEGFPEECPDEEFLEAARLHESDLRASADLIIEGFSRATNDEHRRSILRLWGALRLVDRTVVEKLLDGVMIPMVQGTKTSRESVSHNLHLVQTLRDRDKRRLALAFESEAEEDKEWPQLTRRLVGAGLMSEKGVLGFKRTEHLKDKD